MSEYASIITYKLHLHVCAHILMCVCIHVYMCVCIHVHMCVCV